MAKKIVTSIDVAKKAGVSRTTVSFVLNNVKDQRISEETRKKVLKIVKELGYVPNAAGRALVSDKSKNICLFYSRNQSSHSFLLIDVLSGLTEITRYYGQRLLVDSYEEDVDPEIIETMVRAKQIDGLVMIEPKIEDKLLLKLEKDKFPVVLIGDLPDHNICAVDVDNTGAAKMAVNHLLSIGRKRIGCITNASINDVAAYKRLLGYKKALEHAGIKYDEKFLKYGNYNAESGYLCMESFFKEDSLPDALFIANDIVAIGAMESIKKRGLSIPHDIAVIGFDDVAISSNMVPSLSSIKTPRFEQAKVAVEVLNNLIDGKIKEGYKVVLETKLMQRDSTTI